MIQGDGRKKEEGQIARKYPTGAWRLIYIRAVMINACLAQELGLHSSACIGHEIVNRIEEKSSAPTSFAGRINLAWYMDRDVQQSLGWWLRVAFSLSRYAVDI